MYQRGTVRQKEEGKHRPNAAIYDFFFFLYSLKHNKLHILSIQSLLLIYFVADVDVNTNEGYYHSNHT